jgi:hypothetical protein
MSSDLFRKYGEATRDAVAKALNVPASAFSSEQLTFVDRNESTPWFTVNAVTFGTGTVLAIDPAYRAFAEANPPKKHYRAMSVSFLQSIAEEAARRGHKLNVYSPSLCFTIGAEPPDEPLPPGFEFREHDAAWMNAEQGNRRFENGVGEAGMDGREFRNRFALVLYDAAGEPAAVAGAFDTYGMLEIGIDVVRAQRGRGLGRLAVSALAREIMRRGDVPFYGCAPTNIRSHLTAESSGFRPVLADAMVSAPV